jgi:phage terminase Nu1 subunit (DNA packaging protein)
MTAKATYPVNVIAKLLDLTIRRVYQLTNEGVIPRAEKGRYELVPAVQGYIRYLRDRAIGADALPDESARASRARLIKAQAEAQEMENAKVRGELLPREQVRLALSMVFGVVRNRILAIDKKLPMRVVGCNSLKEIQGISTEMHHEALSELANFELDRCASGSNSPDDQGGASGADASSEVEGERVGGSVQEVVPRKQRRARAVVHDQG